MSDNEASVWQPKQLLQLSADTKRVPETFTATAGMFNFTLTKFVYALGTGALELYKNGLHLDLGIGFVEQTESTFALTAPAAAGDEITAIGYVGMTANVDVRETDIYVANSQALRDYTGTEELVYVQGAITPNDNAGFFQLFTGAAAGHYVDNNYTIIVPTGGDGSKAWVKNSNETQAVSVKDFGAVGDWNGTTGTDDTAAINAAIAHAKTLLSAQERSSYGNGVVVKLSGNHLCLSPINLTDIRAAMNFVFDGNGATIKSKATGKQAIDMLGSKRLVLRDFSVWADLADNVKFGITLGRKTTNEVADVHSFNDVKIQGYYSLASIYNLASEQCTWSNCVLFNDWDSGDNAYAMINDSYHSFGVTSDYADLTGLVVNRNNSFNANQYYGCSFYRRAFDGNDSEAIAIYMDQNCQKHVYIGCYAVAGGIRAVKIKFRDIGTVVTGGWTALNGLYLDLHIEKYGNSSSLSYALDISGEDVTDDLILNDFKYLDNNPHASAGIIKVTDSNTVTMYNSEISIIQTSTGTPTLFVAINKVNFNGKLSLPSTVDATVFGGTTKGVFDLDYRGADTTKLTAFLNALSASYSARVSDVSNSFIREQIAYPTDADLALIQTGVTYHDTSANVLKLKP